MKHTKSRNGFTLIELIIVMVILGIMAAVAVPRYLDSISNAEEAAEDAVISAIRSGLKQYANNSLYESGRAEWPTNPFDALAEKPVGDNITSFMRAEPFHIIDLYIAAILICYAMYLPYFMKDRRQD